MEKNEGNTVKKIRSTEQILVLAILLFTYFLETFQVAYAQKAENLPQIVSWQDGKGYQSDGTFIADGWGYDTVNPAGKYVLFDENGMVQLRTETMDPVNAEDEYSGTELEPANIAVRAEIFEGFTGKVHVTIEENGGVQREIDLDSSVFFEWNLSVNSGNYRFSFGSHRRIWITGNAAGQYSVFPCCAHGSDHIRSGAGCCNSDDCIFTLDMMLQ